MTLRGIDLANLDAPQGKIFSWARQPLSDNTFWTRLARYGEFWQSYLFSNPYVEENARDEYWVPRRALGADSFGSVGLWELKRPEDGRVLDKMAIKQTNVSTDPNVHSGFWRQHLANEAVIQSQLCSMPDSDNIARLRRYKFIGSRGFANPPTQPVRLYMEYAQHGNLGQVLERYRAWDMHFNELFLWHTFLGLARSIDLMRRCPATWRPTQFPPGVNDKDDPSEHMYILHLDLKTQNVALGKRKRIEFDIARGRDGRPNDAESIVSRPEDIFALETEEEGTVTQQGSQDQGVPLTDEDEEQPDNGEEDLSESLGSEDSETDADEYYGEEEADGEREAADEPPVQAPVSQNLNQFLALNQVPAATGLRAASPQQPQPQQVQDNDSDSELSSVDEEIIRRGSRDQDNPADYETDDDEPDHPNGFPRCPTIKILDFGVAICTGPGDDVWNPHVLQDDTGTEHWQSPEARRIGRNARPSLHDYFHDGFKLNEKLNVYDIGKIMYDMMTLSKEADVDNELDLMDAAWQQTYLRPVGLGQLPRRHWTDDITTTKQEEYSPSLRNLVRRCIRPCRSYRPSSARLVALVEAGMKKHLDELGVQGRSRRRARNRADYHVPLSRADFNVIRTRGEANRDVDAADDEDQYEWSNLMEMGVADLDEPKLLPPRDKWGAFYPARDQFPDLTAQNWDQIGNEIVFDKGRAKKRVVSWDTNSQPDAAFRQKTNHIKTTLRNLVANKPIGLLEYVLNQEKGDEDVAVEILRWIYEPGRQGKWKW